MDSLRDADMGKLAKPRVPMPPNLFAPARAEANRFRNNLIIAPIRENTLI